MVYKVSGLEGWCDQRIRELELLDARKCVSGKCVRRYLVPCRTDYRATSRVVANGNTISF